jgi:hypothetical protein
MSLRRMANLSSNDINYTDDYTAPTWSSNSFSFDGTNNIFSGNSTISTTLNNAIVGSNKQFTLQLCVKRVTTGTTQVIFCRDKSSATSARQVLIFFSSNKLVVSLYTNSSNFIQYTSTASFLETRQWLHFTIVYDGTQSATSRLTVYTNGIAEAGSTTQTGTFTTINNITSPNVNIGGRSDAANFSTTKINHVALFNTNLSAINVALLYNNRVPFDIRTNATLNANLVMYLSADQSSVFSTNWAWTDLVGGGVFTSANMVVGDLVADAPALKQISVITIFGQSNAVGRVAMAELDSKYIGALTWLKVWDNVSNSFVNINSTTNNNQLNDFQNQYGIEYYLGNKLNKHSRKTQYILKYAVGGTALTPLETPSWCVPTPGVQPSGGTMWQAVYNTEIPDLLEWELANGFTITKLRSIWIQGEKDSQVLGESTTYETNWLNFIASVINGRLKSYFYVTPKIYDCLLSVNQTNVLYLYKSNINTAKNNVQSTDTTNYRTINTDGCDVSTVDLSHYTKNGNITLANLIGDLIITDGI